MNAEESCNEYPVCNPVLELSTEQVYHQSQFNGDGMPLWLVKEHIKGMRARVAGIFNSKERASDGIQGLCSELKFKSTYPDPAINHAEYITISNGMGNVFLYVKKSLLEGESKFCEWEVKKQYHARWEIQWPFYMNSTNVPIHLDFSNKHFTN